MLPELDTAIIANPLVLCKRFAHGDCMDRALGTVHARFVFAAPARSAMHGGCPVGQSAVFPATKSAARMRGGLQISGMTKRMRGRAALSGKRRVPDAIAAGAQAALENFAVRGTARAPSGRSRPFSASHRQPPVPQDLPFERHEDRGQRSAYMQCRPNR